VERRRALHTVTGCSSTLLSHHNSTVLYRETWPVILSKEYELKMFKRRVQICGCKSEGITGASRMWPNEELHDLYLPGDQIKQNEMHRHVECMGEKTSVYGILVGKPERKGWLCRPRHR
jgi:hypothetical protein